MFSAPPRERRGSAGSDGSFRRTNSLAITLPKAFFAPQVLSVLKSHFESYGEINQWILLPGFGRILLVYYNEDHAEAAKRQCDPIVLKETENRHEMTLRVYRADPNPLVPRDSNEFTIPQESYLQPPELEKNFLISPPGSPPVGWEPIREDPPNVTPLADDLMIALRQLSLREKRSSVEVLLDPEEGSGVGVYVEDCDMDKNDDEVDLSEEDWVYGQTAPARSKWKPVTAMPPMRSALVA
ncbi:Calcipressin [Dendrothele bispora CBS 962.96]|uniref:Calcipressin n=1 Tax=Dendrothele bispora (strain CBS 962.96) TaxID=1314807 RepID=A0A4S8MGX2_DENBC|nr:Calcipressin [Dendrothele bispora CBS 962.96]